MTTMTVQLRSIPDTKAALGWAEGHTIVVDRPDGKAGGMGSDSMVVSCLASLSEAASATTCNMSPTTWASSWLRYKFLCPLPSKERRCS